MNLLWLRVSGRSMWPVAHPLQVGVVTGTSNLDIGDIVAVLGAIPGTVVVHRLQAIDGDRLILRGDTNQAADLPVERCAVLGTVRALRLGPLAWSEPEDPRISSLLRSIGLTWSRLAPRLRAGLGQLRRHRRKTRHNVDMLDD